MGNSLEKSHKKKILYVALSSNPTVMKKAPVQEREKELKLLEQDLTENGYAEDEIQGILQEAKSLDVGSFYAADNVYEFLYKMKMAERDF